MVYFGPLERMGLLLFDRLALSGIAIIGGNGYAFELYRISGAKNNRLDTKSRIGGSDYSGLGSYGIAVFDMGKSAKAQNQEVILFIR